jgi:hypothetical protein
LLDIAGSQKEVGRLQVAVDDAARMNRREGLGDRAAERHRFREGEP